MDRYREALERIAGLPDYMATTPGIIAREALASERVGEPKWAEPPRGERPMPEPVMREQESGAEPYEPAEFTGEPKRPRRVPEPETVEGVAGSSGTRVGDEPAPSTLVEENE